MPDQPENLAELDIAALLDKQRDANIAFIEWVKMSNAAQIDVLECIFGIASNIEDGTEGLDSAAKIKRLADAALNALRKAD